jgi:hypothetical protein
MARETEIILRRSAIERLVVSVSDYMGAAPRALVHDHLLDRHSRGLCVYSWRMMVSSPDTALCQFGSTSGLLSPAYLDPPTLAAKTPPT